MEKIEKVEKLKLSELAEDVKVAIEESSTVYTVADLKREIIELGEPHHLSENWYTVTDKQWSPSAESMVETYLENESCDMYESWWERANDCMTEEVIGKIQSILDEAFNGDYATTYYEYDKPVQIDIFPKEVAKK